MSDMDNPAVVGMWCEILLRFPAVSLLRLRAVCKGWCSVIDDPCFIKAHDKLCSNKPTALIIRNSTGPPFSPLYYTSNLEDLDFTTGLQTIPATALKLTRRGLSRLQAFPVPACNGLLLVAPLRTTIYGQKLVRKGTWEIMNPLTQERLKLPQPTNINYSDRVVGVGLGYDCAADDYKVVVIHGEKYDKQTHVYSLRWDSWRTTIGSCPFGEFFRNRNGVFLRGALHWVSDDRMIVFDVGTESYRQLALPSSFDRKTIGSMHLEVLSGCLFLCCTFEVDGETESWMNDFWVMDDFVGGKRNKWTKLFSLDRIETRFSPIAYMMNKRQQMVVLLQGYYKNDEFAWFDVESKTLKRIEIHGISSRDWSAQVCVGSLFRLHDSCGSGGRPPSKTRNLKKMAAAHTKLTFCERDGDNYDPSLDNCQSESCPNWYHSESRIKVVCETSTFDPDGNSFTLPLDIWHKIFLRFPAKSVIQFRAVCKDWKAVIDDPCFVKAHTTTTTTVLIRNSTGSPFLPLFSFDLDELDFTKALQTITVTPHESTGLSEFPCLPVAECNGLMLVGDNEKLQLWNPLTNERLELPQIERFINSNHRERVATGLGYEEATNDYKVVVVHSWEGEEKVIMFRTHVYSLRLDSWNMILGEDEYRPEGRGVFLCGVLHWFLSWGQQHRNILALDLRTESYRWLKGPPLESRGGWLDVLGGCLIVTEYEKGYDGNINYYDMWVMKDYGSEDSWTNLSTLDGEPMRPLAYVNNKTQLFLQDGSIFYLFDIESELVKNVICIHGLTGDLTSQIFPGSIFRLHDNCGVGGRRRMRKRKNNMKIDTELYFCVRDYDSANDYEYENHDSCYVVDSNWYCSSSEDED